MTKESKELLIWTTTKRIVDIRRFIANEKKGRQNVIDHPEYYQSPSEQIIWHNKRINEYENKIIKYQTAINELAELYTNQI